jgi:hypothetical protein
VPEAGDVAWLISLAYSGVVPVVSLAASSEVGWQDGETWQFIAALATALQVASGHCSFLHFRGATEIDVLSEALPSSVDIRKVTLSELTA